MTRGRKRKADPSIPRHIDQAALPRGLYWDRTGAGRWFVFETGAHGRPKRTTVATAAARLSELHEIMETRAGVDRGTLAWLLDEFHASKKFKALAPATRKGYEFYRGVAKDFQTKSAGKLGEIACARLTPPAVQRIVDKIADDGTPTKANALLRYMRRVFRWGVNRGKCPTNPAKGVEQATERRQRRMPDAAVVSSVLAFARVHGAYKAHTKGSVAPYLWMAIELAYLCRLRGIEALMLTDASATDEGVRVARVKGSRDNIVRWTPRLREVWDAAVAYRKLVTPSNAVVQIDPAKRVLIVSQEGTPLRKSSLDTAWQRMILAAIDARVITAEQRFSLHGMKHRGITDTPGTRGEKQLASGHKSEAMLDVYDHSLPHVDPASEA
jgi:site-specific recombinase XerC